MKTLQLDYCDRIFVRIVNRRRLALAVNDLH